MDPIYLVVAVVVWIVCGFVAREIALEKGLDAQAWFISGVLFGPFAIAAAAWTKPRSR